MYAAPRMMPVVQIAVVQVEIWYVPNRLRNSATKPLVPGSPIDAIVNSMKNSA